MEPTYPNAVPDPATDGSALQGPVIDPSAVAEPPNDSSAQFANVGNHPSSSKNYFNCINH